MRWSGYEIRNLSTRRSRLSKWLGHNWIQLVVSWQHKLNGWSKSQLCSDHRSIHYHANCRICLAHLWWLVTRKWISFRPRLTLLRNLHSFRHHWNQWPSVSATSARSFNCNGWQNLHLQSRGSCRYIKARIFQNFWRKKSSWVTGCMLVCPIISVNWWLSWH